jgi:hypothetical protein
LFTALEPDPTWRCPAATIFAGRATSALRLQYLNHGKPREPFEYFGEIAEKHPDRLIARSVPMDRKLWKLDKIQDFLRARRQLLAEAVSKLLQDPSFCVVSRREPKMLRGSSGSEYRDLRVLCHG